jgi:hypothetical protein
MYTTWPLEGCLTRNGLSALSMALVHHLARHENDELRNLMNHINSHLERQEPEEDLLA